MNASQWSARYAERKRAAQRAELDKPLAPRTCCTPGCGCLAAKGRIICAHHDGQRNVRAAELIASNQIGSIADTLRAEFGC